MDEVLIREATEKGDLLRVWSYLGYKVADRLGEPLIGMIIQSTGAVYRVAGLVLIQIYGLFTWRLSEMIFVYRFTDTAVAFPILVYDNATDMLVIPSDRSSNAGVNSNSVVVPVASELIPDKLLLDTTGRGLSGLPTLT